MHLGGSVKKKENIKMSIFLLYLEKKTMLIEILDKTIPGDISNSFKLDLEEITTPQKIISARVEKEVKTYNKKADDKMQSLVRPLAKETILNGIKRIKEVDVEKQIYVALEAFQKNAFFILVDLKTVILDFSTFIFTPIFFKILISVLITLGLTFKREIFFPDKAAAITYVPNSILSNIILWTKDLVF